VRGVTVSRPLMQQILRPTVKQLSVGCVVRSLTTGTRYWAVEKQLQTMPLEPRRLFRREAAPFGGVIGTMNIKPDRDDRRSPRLRVISLETTGRGHALADHRLGHCPPLGL
jgi:hypothetical protein